MYVNLRLWTSIAHIDNIHHLFSTKNTLMIRASWVLHLLQRGLPRQRVGCIRWLLLWCEKRSPGKHPDLAKYQSSFLLSTLYLENICPSPLHLLGLAMNHRHVNSLPVEKKGIHQCTEQALCKATKKELASAIKDTWKITWCFMVLS